MRQGLAQCAVGACSGVVAAHRCRGRVRDVGACKGH